LALAFTANPIINLRKIKMKRVILTLSVVLFALVALKAQTVAQPAASQPVVAVNPNAPVITFTNLVHDYGTINKGGDGNCEFEFKNTGVEPLILSNCQSSCGCTVPDWPKEPILKGKTAVVKVKYATERLGPINKTITVTSNASNSPIVLKITGNVIEKTEGAVVPEKNLNAAQSPVSK
jgi:hypothetical protein